MKRIAVISMVVGLVTFVLGAQAQDATVTSHIAHVESGLLAAVQIKGAAVEMHTLAERMNALHVPGVSIAVMRRGRIEWAKGYGVAGIGGPRVTPETRFQAGSISKPVAALASLHLVEKGKLSLDTDVNDSLKMWKLPPGEGANAKPVTLRELLTHTGGTTIHGFPGYAAGEEVPNLVQVLNGEKPANTKPVRIEAVPGTKWNYSGGGYSVMQQMMIDVSGQDFPTLLERSVLKPIGMTHSTYRQPLPEQFMPLAATPYDSKGEPIKGGAHTYPEMAAAGLWTTATDILLFAREIQTSLVGKSNNVLSAKMARAMLTPGLGHWGLGLDIGGSPKNPHFGHGGSNAGFQATFAAYELNGDGAAVMTNGNQGGDLAAEIMRSIATEYGWPDFKPTSRNVVSIDPAILPRYEGTYTLTPMNFNLVFKVEGGRLVVYPGQDKPALLYAESETKFFPLNPDVEMEFVSNAQGQVEYLLLHEGDDVHKMVRK